MADRTVKVSLVAGVNSFISDWERAQRSVDKAANATEAATAKYEKQAAAMQQVGGAVTAAGAVAVAATALAVKAAIDWESAWAGVTKTVDGSAEEMGALEESLRGLARELPATHTEIAAVAEAAGQLGVAREDIASFTRVMIDLAETTNLTADEAATAIAQISNIMRTAPEDIDNFASTLVALGNDGASTEREILQMAQRIAGAGKLVGATEGEVLALSNALASMGVTAELGGGVASRILQDLYSAVQTGGEQLKAFADVAGLTSADFAKKFNEDPVRALDAFAKGLNTVEASGGNVVQTLTDIGFRSTEEQRVLLQLKSSGDLLAESLNLQAVAWAENTALSEEAQKRYETTAAQLQVLGNKANDTAITFGSAFLPAVGAVTEAVGDLLDGFSDLPEGMQQQIAVLGGLAGAATLAGGAFLLAVPKIAEFRIALGVLSSSSIPAVATAAGAATGAIGKVGSAAGSVARFLVGPWGLALTAAAVGVGALDQALNTLRATAAEYENAIRNATTANDLFAVSDRGTPISTLSQAIKDADTFKAKLDIIANNPFLKGFDIQAQQLDANLGRIGEQLGALSATDLPAAQNGFRLLAEQFVLSNDEQSAILDRMPEFRDALIEQANELGIQVEGLSEAERATALLKLAQGDGARAAEDATDSYANFDSQLQQVKDSLTQLIDELNEANGVGQDAISANIAYGDALARLDEQIALARNGTEGYALTLDQSTQAGRDNLGLLNDLAGSAIDAAKAQLILDGDTGAYINTIRGSRDALIQRAQDLGYNADEARNLADQILSIPSEREARVLVETQQAVDRVSAFKALWEGIKSRTITLTPVTPVGPLAGGYAFDGKASGGIIPGAPSDRDNRIYALATGEFVVRAREVSKPQNRAILEAMNSGYLDAARLRNAGITGYADGGYVQPGYASSSSRVSVAAPIVNLPDSLVLQVDGQQFTAYVKGAANEVVADNSRRQTTRLQAGTRR